VLVAPVVFRIRPLALVSALTLLGSAAAALATAQTSADASLSESLSALPVMPARTLEAQRQPAAMVVPSQVLRWRQEAIALEHGENGSARDPVRAARLYCQAARHGDAESQFALAWMLTNARGLDRDEPAAAHLFAAAAEQGMPQAQRMARQLGTPLGEPPACLRPPELDVVAQRPPLIAPATAAMPPPPTAVQPVKAAPARLPLASAARALTEHPLYQEAPRPIAEFVRLVAPDYQLVPQLVLAVMAAESNFNPNAVSPKQAQGLMQLIPDTAARFNVRNILDPAQNIRGGMAYLRWLLAFFEGDVALAVAAYNAGERAVERYRGVPPYAETRAYVRKVMALLNEGDRLPFDARATEPSPVLPLIRPVRR
jgi:soluble lytic murein transglycosylase-like protein